MKKKDSSCNKVIATKYSWITSKMPQNKIKLSINKKYSKEEYNKIKKGFIPQQMDDRWFIYFENQKLYFHRSWSGYCIYEIKFSKENEYYIITEGYLNKEIVDEKNLVLKDEAKRILLLINRLLLDENNCYSNKD